MEYYTKVVIRDDIERMYGSQPDLFDEPNYGEEKAGVIVAISANPYAYLYQRGIEIEVPIFV